MYTTATKPMLTSTSTDADGNKVQILFEALTSTSSSTVVSSCTTGLVASAATASCALGTALSNNSQYVVRAKVKDDQGLWQASASSWTTIRVATSAPPSPDDRVCGVLAQLVAYRAAVDTGVVYRERVGDGVLGSGVDDGGG